MALPIYSSEEYLQKMLAVPRVCAKDILAFYEHRVGGICTDPKLMFAPLDDHIAHRGDGVFETVKYTEGRLYQLDPHLERLERSAAGLFLKAPCSLEKIREMVLEVAAAGKERVGQMRILLGRGPGGFGIDPAECPEPSLYLVAYRFHVKPESWFINGLKGFRTSIPAKQSYMAKLKNTNYVPNMLMIREAREKGADTPFCFDELGYLAESAIANLCIVDATGTLSVPEFTSSLPGTTLLRALELLKGTLPITFRRISEGEITSAKEVILFGTGPDCVAITSYEGKQIGNGKAGPIAEKARKLIVEDIRATGTPIPGLA
ncbi:Aminotransferase class IV [uncultured delta proteobacterium]|uniref:Aminotransferase class IV n=1 Tax=uncultured delta proteobacterium TaxID=34034 RepID=A0A212JJB0_9DELT|nr:Aminotransferase class IV [uncultured delta proteobacterium]